MKAIELLAPAKDLECGIAAIDHGADAVYIGAPAFGAREAAGNNIDDIAQLTKYAHSYWAKVYVTVNTLLYDEEIPEAVSLIGKLYELGVDGVIIQDVGLLECDLPPIPIIASTQMHNHTPERVAFLEKVGFKRAILARELDLDQIKEISDATSIELEVFVHGSLCVSYSGQCYVSYAIGKRSGNRGQCAQACRKAYNVYDESGMEICRNKHILSLKDLNLSADIESLIDAGVTSFKIEGRLKEKSYVSNIVAYYRAEIDKVLAKKDLVKASSGTSNPSFTPDPNKTFNRGYSSYFLHGDEGKIASIDTPKMVGEEAGIAVRVYDNNIVVDTDLTFHAGDGICFYDQTGALRGSTINKVVGNEITPNNMDGIVRGIMIYRNRDHEFLTAVEKARTERLIDVKMTVERSETGLSVRAIDEGGVEAVFAMDCELAEAMKPDQAIENIKKQMSKTGGTMFACSDVNVDIAQPVFVPISVLNNMRRSVLEGLTAAREATRVRETGHVLVNDEEFPEKKLFFYGNVLNKHAEKFYKRHGVVEIEPAAESSLDLSDRTVMTTRYCIRRELGICEPGNTTPLILEADRGRRLTAHFNCGECGMDIVY